MKRLHLFVIKSFIGPLVLTFFIVLFILIMQFLWKYIDDLVGKGLELDTLSELLFYFSVSFIPMALPLAVLLASLMTFGNLGENLELTALKSAGISLQRIMTPLIILVIMISIGAFFFSNNVLPRANLKSRSLLWDIQQQRPELNIKAGSFYNGIDGFSIKVARKDPKTNLLRKVLIYDHRDKQGNVAVTYADSGYMRMSPGDSTLILTLYNGNSYNEVLEEDRKRIRRNIRTYPHRRETFKEQTVMLALTGFGLSRSDEDLFKKSYSMMNIDQLSFIRDSMIDILHERKEIFTSTMLQSHYYIYSRRMPSERKKIKISDPSSIPKFEPYAALSQLSFMEQLGAVDQALSYAKSSQRFITSSGSNLIHHTKRIRRYQIEWHRKFTLSFACFIFFFIGAPLGAIIRKGGLGMPVVVSVVFFVIYYVITLTGEKFVREDVLSPFTGMWISSIILLPLGIFLTYKATVDSAILNIDTYYNFLKKLLLHGKRALKMENGNY
ncbi:MAG: LptF/LptG family permease [Bacteroidales bacterium]|nr:MAG: LptF/LptG family permease [Bacteroidales bacterium]